MQQPEEYAGYVWDANWDNDAPVMVRQLTNLERMFVILNRDLYGQNCPFLGATISIEHHGDDVSSKPLFLTPATLRTRAIEAFCQTRWVYPTVAARLARDSEAIYPVESEAQVKAWAERTVFMVEDDGGWITLRERLSRESPIPSIDGDYCLIYLIVSPAETAKSGILTFDILIHTHHVFTDGAGIRSILNEFLTRLAEPLESTEMQWGQEVGRLLPASPLLEKDEEAEAAPQTGQVNGASVSADRLKGWTKVCVPTI